MSIPKIIHYCWFGHNPIPELAVKCIESWRKYNPDYKIIEWNDENVDISACPVYVQTAYSLKKWAFVTDYVRLMVVYEHGGIYLDTDVELLRPLDSLVTHRAFMGCEGTQYVNTGLGFGAEKGFSFLRENMRVYEEMDPINEAGEFVSSPCPHYTTQLLKERGVVFPIEYIVETTDGMVIYPNRFFNPYNWKTKQLQIDDDTISIHLYSGSWMTEQQRKGLVQRAKVEQMEQHYGKKLATIYDVYFWNQKKNGGPGILSWFINKLRGL